MSSLYFLIFELNPFDEYDVYEQHQGQEKGCLLTNREPVDVIARDKLDQFICEFADKCESFGDKLVSCEVVVK